MKEGTFWDLTGRWGLQGQHRHTLCSAESLGNVLIHSQNDAIDPNSFSRPLLGAGTKHTGHTLSLRLPTPNRIFYFPRKLNSSGMKDSVFQILPWPCTNECWHGPPQSLAHEQQRTSATGNAATDSGFCFWETSSPRNRPTSLPCPKGQAFFGQLLLSLSFLTSSVNRISFFLCHCA